MTDFCKRKIGRSTNLPTERINIDPRYINKIVDWRSILYRSTASLDRQCNIYFQLTSKYYKKTITKVKRVYIINPSE